MARHGVQVAVQRSIFVGAAVLAAGISGLHDNRALRAQAPATDAPSFEVASVKPNASGDGFMRIGGPPGRFAATNVPLRQLIQMAYEIQPFQLEGGSGWISSDRFDIVAKTDTSLTPPVPGVPGPLQLMMRTLLADRFKLVVHHETKEQAIYALVLARADGKLGPQLKKSETDCAAMAAAARGRSGPPPAPPAPGVRPQCGMMMRPGGMSAGGFPLSQLVASLSANLQRVVVDRTGLTGTFDLDLTWTPDQMPQRAPGAGDGPIQFNGVPIDPNGPSLFTAIQEQLGLKLESTKGQVDMLVIDRAEKPAGD
jgi:uncharacterized protein (TIGR03435 family)